VIVYGIVAEYGLSGLAVSTMLAGAILVCFGVLRLGNVIKFIPHTVIVGFTSGIAVTIFSTQVKDALGLALESAPEHFLPKWGLYLESLGTADGWSLLTTAGSMGVILIGWKLFPRVPGSLIAIILATAAVHVFSLPVDTIGTRFSDLPANFSLSWPGVDFARISEYLHPAFTIAMLGAIESLLSAVVADGMIGDEHHSNTELIAQGVANLVTPLFGGIPATGAIARTVTNVKSGGATPVAGVVHALTLLTIALSLGQYAKLIPMPCLAGILILVAYNMSEWRTFLSLLRAPVAEVAVLLATFLLTVLVDLTVAIEIGMILASFTFIQRMSDLGTIFRATIREPVSDTVVHLAGGGAMSHGKSKVDVFEISGPFFFAAAREYQRVLQSLGTGARAVVIRMRHVPFVDETGIRSFRDTIRFMLRSRRVVVLSGVREAVRRDFRRYGIIEMLGEDRIFPNFAQAMDYINSLPEPAVSARSASVGAD
ncbi:MAG: STAS domain-containing protein, partial [Planctomycetota bacterium]|nr:STAS domain-containing protein [Planctomycetota bacterium]